MEWFTQMSVTEQVLFWIAVVATVGLVIQIIMMIFSFGGGDVDVSDFDGDIDTDGGLSVFTIKGLTAFFALGGWCGFATISYVPDMEWIAILVAFATGTVALLGVGFAMKAMTKLQCSGNLDKEKLEGLSATVYVSIPPTRSGRGKITLTAQGKYMNSTLSATATKNLRRIRKLRSYPMKTTSPSSKKRTESEKKRPFPLK